MTKSDSGKLRKSGETTSVDGFLRQLEATPQRPARDGRPGRLIFAMDATASRAPTWDMACHLQSQMFSETGAIGPLDIQLVFFRGYKECKASKWVGSAGEMLRLMRSVQCLAGRTQIERVIKHALHEVKTTEVDAIVYVGDSFEEQIDVVGEFAGELKLRKLPMFLFQEGNNFSASDAFRQLAILSGGAHCSLDQNSASQLGELLTAVAVFAAGGRSALDAYGKVSGPLTRRLLAQL